MLNRSVPSPKGAKRYTVHPLVSFLCKQPTAKIDQNTIRLKIISFLELLLTDADILEKQNFIKEFRQGYCHGYGFLIAYAIWLEHQPKTNPNRDDWTWVKHVLEVLSKWDGKNLTALSEEDRKQIERFISIIEHLQHSTFYRHVSQTNLYKIFEDTKNRKLERTFSIAGAFTLNDITKTITLENGDETSLFDLLFKEEGAIIGVSSYNHSVFFLRFGDDVFFIDANNPNAFKVFHQKQKYEMLSLMFLVNLREIDKPSPWAFYINSFNPKKSYPSQQDILAAIKPKLEPCKEYENKSGLHMAAVIECNKSLKYHLGQIEVDIDAVTDKKVTALFTATSFGNIKGVSSLLFYGANVNLTPITMETPLHAAVKKGHKEIVKMLLEDGAKLDVKSKEGSPFDVAIEYNEDSEIIKLMLAHAVTQKITISPSALFIAVNRNNLEVAKLLTAHGVNVNARLVEHGMTPLFAAIKKGTPEMVKFLIANGADLNALLLELDSTITPLFFALQMGRPEITNIILDEIAKSLDSIKTGTQETASISLRSA